jgi:hypothetical protein
MSDIDMAEWTKKPKVTGAYWGQIKGFAPDILWIHEGRIFGLFHTKFSELNEVEYCAEQGMMFYGPLDSPPPLPEDE